nr:c1q globular head like domain containing protein [uncultured Mediterranean phage uvMED]
MYIGSSPTIGNFQVCDAISVVNGQASYTMQVSSVNVVPQSAFHMLVSLNGILQKSNSSFTVSGSTITFASNLQTGDVIDFIHILGDVLDLGVPSDNTVSLAKLTATGTKDATTFLRGDNTFQEVPSGLGMADQWRLTTSFTGDATLSSNLERVDTYGFGQLGTGMTESSGAFSFPSTGIYYISFTVTQKNNDNITKPFNASKILTTTNNSTYNSATEVYQGITAFTSGFYGNMTSNFIFDVTDTSTHKVKFSINAYDSAVATEGDTNTNLTFMTFLRLGDT